MCRGINGLKQGSKHSELVHIHWLGLNVPFWRLLGKSALIYRWKPRIPLFRDTLGRKHTGPLWVTLQ